MSAASQARLTVDLDALSHNHAALVAEAAGAEVAPVVKADGYGLGSGPIAQRLWARGARSFFVARLSEGEALRNALGAQRQAAIYVLDGMTPGSGARLADAGLTPVISTLSQLKDAAEFNRPLAIQVDTGMNRQGLPFEDALALDSSALDAHLVMSHLGGAADPDDTHNSRQLQRFCAVRARFPQARASLAASAGIFLGPDYRFDLVRPGISLYGGGPREIPDPRLRAVATFTAPVLYLRQIAAGERIGYGSAVTADSPTRIAIVGAGYADGFLRLGRAGGVAFVAGALRRILIINMDLLAVDIGDADVQVGQQVELLGDRAQLDNFAAAAQTVAHEVLVRISSRAERFYLGEG